MNEWENELYGWRFFVGIVTGQRERERERESPPFFFFPSPVFWILDLCDGIEKEMNCETNPPRWRFGQQVICVR